MIKHSTCWALLIALSSAGCSVMPERAAIEPHLPTQFAATGEAPAPKLWWQSFADPALDEWVAIALRDNPGVQIVAARLRAADAVASANGAALFPNLSASGSHTRDYGDQADAQLNSAGLSAGYEVDLWGRIRAGRDAAQLQAASTAAELRAAQITLSANVAVLWYQIGSTEERLRRIETEREVYERILQLVDTRYRYGQAPASDVLRQRQLVESTRSLQAATSAELGTRRHALAELLGIAAGTTELPGRLPIQLPAVPASGVPAQTITRRPDVQQAWLQVRAADRSVAAAIANRFPQLDLSANYGSGDTGTASLFDNWIGSLVATLAGPIVDGGARRAEVRRTRAVLDQRIAEYSRAVLAAFREVADALLQDGQLQLRVTSIDEQLRLSDQVVDRLERQLRNGSDSYLSLLDAQITNSGLRREVINVRQQLAEQRIALYRSLAGPLPQDETRLLATGAGNWDSSDRLEQTQPPTVADTSNAELDLPL